MNSYYAFEGEIRYYGLIPKTVELVKIATATGIPEDAFPTRTLQSDASPEARHAALGDAVHQLVSAVANTYASPGDFLGTLGPERTDPSRWKEPPHVKFANISDASPKTVELFIRKYGPLQGQRTYMGLKDGSPQFHESVDHFKSFQEVLRSAWTEDSKAIREIEHRVEAMPYYDERLGLKGIRQKIWLGFRDRTIDVYVDELERFICLLFFRDYVVGNVGVCASLDCPARYFLRSRKGQQFCSHKCAVLVNVRRFRAFQEKAKKRKKVRRNKP
jgi:hypothetical protein